MIMKGIMAQALSTIPTTPIPTTTTRSPALVFSKAHNDSPPKFLNFQTPSVGTVQRRNIINFGVIGAIWGLNLGEKNAWAAARRPPPPPPEEKKDPNISGVQAKVLASKKRKEAMKQAMAQQRERGKKIEQ